MCLYSSDYMINHCEKKDENEKQITYLRPRQSYNRFHNMLRLFDVLPNFSFTKSETMLDYYL